MEFATKCVHAIGAADATGSITPARKINRRGNAASGIGFANGMNTFSCKFHINTLLKP